MAAELTHRIANLNPFASKPQLGADDENYGDVIASNALAGGGHGARKTNITENKLRVSTALRAFLVGKGILSTEDAGLDSSDAGGVTNALQALMQKPHLEVPAELTDRSHPLSEYFISSSHNTYLTANQLTGGASAVAYETALNTGSRCVEIDAWDNEADPQEPKVTHGYTLVSHIPFRAVCETIRDVVDKEAAQSRDEQGYRSAPIFISLENHCNGPSQLRLVEIMEEVWGDRLLRKEIRDKAHAEEDGEARHVTLEELGSDIVLIVEYHFPKIVQGEAQKVVGEVASQAEEDTSDDDEDEDDDQKQARKDYNEKAKASSKVDIIPELADLGVYARSVKPVDNSWFELATLTNGPHHHLINLSEVQLSKYMPANDVKIANHNAHNLMRVYPKGSRISSKNLQPVPFWGLGAQICALNWQTFGHSLQLNEALFSGTDGYVLKPAPLRAGGDGNLNLGTKKKVRLHIAGATDIPVPPERKDPINPYVTCLLYHAGDVKNETPKRKTSVYKKPTLLFLKDSESPPPTDPVWDEVLEWEYDDNELVILRILIKSDDKFARNPHLAVTSLRLLYSVPGYNFIRMLGLKGQETTCTLLAKVEIVDA